LIDIKIAPSSLHCTGIHNRLTTLKTLWIFLIFPWQSQNSCVC